MPARREFTRPSSLQPLVPKPRFAAQHSELAKEYLLTRHQVGRGGFATVDLAFRARDLLPVAVKMFQHRTCPDFQSEYAALSALTHPNVVALIQKVEGGSASLVLEYAERGAVAGLLRKVRASILDRP